MPFAPSQLPRVLKPLPHSTTLSALLTHPKPSATDGIPVDILAPPELTEQFGGPVAFSAELESMHWNPRRVALGGIGDFSQFMLTAGEA